MNTRISSLPIDESILDDDFFKELELHLGISEEENRNCGTGAVGGKQGFQPGNKCAGDGEKSKGKAEGKKKDVHSDWDDGATSDRYWESSDDGRSGVSGTTRGEIYFSEIYTGYKDGYGIERPYELSASRTNKKYGSGKYLVDSFSLDESPVYNFQFTDPMGSQSITGSGGAQKIFREVVNRGLSLYDHKDIGVIKFSADRAEPSRVKLYDFLARFAAKRRGAEVFVDNNRSGAVVFHVAKPKYAEKYDEWHRKEDKPIYPIDTFWGI